MRIFEVTNWVWALKIEPANHIKYYDLANNQVDDNVVANALQIEVEFGDKPRWQYSLKFEHFALLGIYKKKMNNGFVFDTEKLFFINSVEHGIIEKAPSTKITRTIRLTFPIPTP